MTLGREAQMYVDWNAKLLACLRLAVDNRIDPGSSGDRPRRRRSQRTPSNWNSGSVETCEALLVASPFGAHDVFGRSPILHPSGCRRRERIRGIEVVHAIALTKRAHLKATITIPPARRVEDLEANLLKVEAHMNRYQVLAGRPLDEDLTVTILIEASLPEHCSKLEMSQKDLCHTTRLGTTSARTSDDVVTPRRRNRCQWTSGTGRRKSLSLVPPSSIAGV